MDRNFKEFFLVWLMGIFMMILIALPIIFAVLLFHQIYIDSVERQQQIEIKRYLYINNRFAYNFLFAPYGK